MIAILLGAASVGEAAAAPVEVATARHLAAGVRFGLMPPVLTVVELLARPVPHLTLGVFGMTIPDRSSLGAELLIETAQPGKSTPYLEASYLSYHDTRPRWERSQVGYVTVGYIWRSAIGLECQVGGGAMFILSEELAPCSQWFCASFMGPPTPPVFPTLDLALRFGFL